MLSISPARQSLRVFPLVKSPLYSRQRGATLLEFVISLPLLVLIMIGLVDFCRYLTIRAIVTHSAQRAVALAATLPGLDSDDTTSSDFTSAKQQIEDEARSQALILLSATPEDSMQYLSQTDGIKVDIPEPQNGMTMQRTLSEKAVGVVVTAKVVPFLPFLPVFTAKASAYGYREPRQIASLPVRIDCNGNPAGSTTYNAGECPCGKYAYWSYTDKQCYCLSGLIGDPTTECRCPEHYSLYLASGTPHCQCALLSEDCGQGQIVDSKTCKCACDAAKGFIQDGESCSCKSGFENQSGTCKCTAQCGPNFIQIQSDCSCSCPDPFEPHGSGADQTCECPATKDQQGTTCVCKAPTTPCQGNQVQDSTTCQCKCPASCPAESTQNPTACSCSCNNPDKVLSANGASCNCRSDLSCPGGAILDTAGDCSCDCPTGSTWNSQTSQCACDNAAKHIENGSCTCTSTTCPAGSLLNQTSCVCECRPGFIPDGSGGCKCANPNWVILANGSCGCSTSSPQCTDGHIQDTQTCACVCPSSSAEDGSGTCRCSNTAMEIVNGSCQCSSFTCSANQVANMTTCACDCKTSAGFQTNGSSCACSDPNKEDNNNGSCVCRSDLAPCPTGATRNTSTCQCACPSGSTEQGGACVCTDATRELASGQCLCKNRNSCPAHSTLNATTCECACKSGFTKDGAGNCNCTDPNKEPSGDTCVCRSDLEQCPVSGQIRDSNCNCACKGQLTPVNGVCSCPEGRSETTPGSGQCGCSTTCPSRSSQQSNCSCQCWSGYSWLNGMCANTSECPGAQCTRYDPNTGNCENCLE